jgi:hypothetical protein
MVYYNHLYYNNQNNSVYIYLDSTNNEDTFNNIVDVDIIEITINTHKVTNSLDLKKYINLPNHQHVVEDIKDLVEYTNTENGFVKLNNKKLAFDFNWTAEIDRFSIKESLFEID